ncbi:MAG: alpha/beta hydrolase, partial [Nakamurella sp.]
MTNSQAFEAKPTHVPSTQYLDRSDGRIGYDVTGSGPLIIAVPGMGDLRSSYRHLTPALVAAGFRVATMDLRGHGDSDTTFAKYDDPAASSDILALAAHLGGPALVIGNSMGAAAAVIAAAQQPAAISGLVLVGPFVRNPSSSAVMKLVFRVTFGGPWARRAWLAYFPKFFPTRRDADYAEHRAAIAAATARPGYAKTFRATTRVSHDPSEAVLDQVHTEVLVVMGSKDPDFPDQQAEANFIADRLHGRVAMIPDAGHYPQAELPELTSPVIVEFAQQIRDAS